MPDPHPTLQALGLNRLEAEVYTHLLRQSEPATAYAIGKALGKATANVYKAIEALAIKGAVTIEEGDRRLCHPAPVDEFLSQLERSFRGHARQAREELRELEPASAAERVERLASVPLVLERASFLLARARKTIVLDAFPRALEAIRDAVEAATARGVEVRVLAYAPISLEGAEVIVAPRGATSLDFWRCQQLNLVADAQEALVALLSQDLDRVFQALWSNDLYLSCMLHAGLGMERTIHRLDRLRDRADLPDELREILEGQRFFYNSNLPGQQRLFARYGVPVTGEGEESP